MVGDTFGCHNWIATFWSFESRRPDIQPQLICPPVFLSMFRAYFSKRSSATQNKPPAKSRWRHLSNAASPIAADADEAHRLDQIEQRMSRWVRNALFIVSFWFLVGCVVWLSIMTRKSDRLEIVRSASDSLPGDTTRAIYSKLVDRASFHSGWQANVPLGSWYNSLGDRVYDQHNEFYVNRGGGHPMQYRRHPMPPT